MSNLLVSFMQIGLFSHIEYMFLFLLFFYLKTMPLSSLKIMKKSPITEYSDGFKLVNSLEWCSAVVSAK